MQYTPSLDAIAIGFAGKRRFVSGFPSEQIVLARGKYLQLVQATVTGPSGDRHHRDIVLHPGAVAILPILENDQICLVRNRRLAVGETLLEIPAGTLEKDEPPEVAAPRELAEETGYQAGRWEKLCTFYPSPGCLSEITHLFVASQLTPGQMHLEQDEDLEPCLLAWEELRDLVRQGKIRDAKTIIAVLWWSMFRAN